LTYAAIILDAQDGSFQQASWVEEPTRFIQVTKDKAIELVLALNPGLAKAELDAGLVWQQGSVSNSPFYPYWEIDTGGGVYLVTQDGEVSEREVEESERD